jgi:predicted nucleotide-binding protein
MVDAAHQRLSDLKDELARLAAYPWSNVESWTAKATPMIRRDWPDDLDDFRKVTKKPLFPVSLSAMREGREDCRDAEANRSLAEEAKARILSFLDGLLAASTDIGLEILRAVDRLQGSGAQYVADTAIAEALKLDVQELTGHLEILEEEGRVDLAKHMKGCGAYLTPRQRLRLKEVPVMSHEPRQTATATDPRKVFVVHGRNRAARDAAFTFLRSIGLHPLEWTEVVKATGKASPYIGEVLETGFSIVQAVVVLMTPDDEARLREPYRGSHEPPDETELTPQPRPNVLIEAGMALGHFPERTVIVELGRLRQVSDLLGRHTVRMDDSAEKRQELAQRLETAGCAVNRSGTDWYEAGRFEAALQT